jgi:hypothetical protein
MRLFTGAGAGAAPSGGRGAALSRRVRLDKRLEILERRLSEQEALLQRLHELLGMPPRPAILMPWPPRSPPIWRRMPIAVAYAFGVFTRLIVGGIATLLALAVVAAMLRLISK